MTFRTRDHRKSIPASVKVECLMVALAEALGLASDTRFEFDHTPALCLRDFDPETGRFEPDQNDPAFIVVRTPEDHRVKTFGTKATTYGSDIFERAKDRRITKDQEEFRRRMLAKEPGKPREKSPRWGKRSFRPAVPRND
jgi:hypothetical protein